MKAPKSILLSRTDSIGDVVLTLPLAGAIKAKLPETKIFFLGVSYTKDVVVLSKNIDEFINWNEIRLLPYTEQVAFFESKKIDCAIHVFPNKNISKVIKAAKVPTRAGTSHRIFHWLTCNKLISFSRRNSEMHEAQLNFKLIEFLGVPLPRLSEISGFYGLKVNDLTGKNFLSLIDKNKINVLLHPKSKGSAREWGLENFSQLIHLLPKEKVKIFIGGSKEEGSQIDSLIKNHPEVSNVCGKFSLKEYIDFISACDVFVAASTGPLHIAAALNKRALGIFAPMKPIHPGRWSPIGNFARSFVIEKSCNECRKTMKCKCIQEISPVQIASEILK